MSRFDEEPDADPHGECAAEIHRLQAQVEALTAELNNVGLPKLAMCPACTEEVPMLQCDQLTQDAKRYRAIREGLEVDENSGIVVSLVDDFGGETLNGEVANNAIDAAIAKGTAA